MIVRYKFLVLAVKKIVKIGVHLRKLSLNQNRGTAFLDHSLYCVTVHASKGIGDAYCQKIDHR